MNAQRLRLALALFVFLVPSTALGASGAARMAGTWQRLAAAPIAPDFGIEASVWTGSQMLVFGRDEAVALDSRGKPYSAGAVNVAAAYEPSSNAWRRLTPPQPAAGWGLDGVWTGKEMLVWGHGTRLAFDPATDHWRQLPWSRLLAIHDGFGAVVWTGREMIGWGGGCCGDAFNDGVSYSPTTNKWRPLPRTPLPGNQHPLGAWTGRVFIVVSGVHAAAYDPAKNAWRRIASMPSARENGRAVWDGREILVVGGARVGFAYKPATNRWRRLPAVPVGRVGRVTVWTGRHLLVWGGKRGGAAYDPRTNGWSTIPRGPLPSRLEPTAVWTGHAFIVWGGLSTKTWGKYDAAGATFTPVTP